MTEITKSSTVDLQLNNLRYVEPCSFGRVDQSTSRPQFNLVFGVV